MNTKNKTYCNGKFILKNEKDEDDLKHDAEIDAEIEKERKLRKVGKKEKERIANASKYTKLNDDVREAVFSYIRHHLGREVYDVVVTNGYFVFDMGKGSVVQFKVRGPFLKHYRFGMWISAENFYHKPTNEMGVKELKSYNKLGENERKNYYRVVEIFQQHEDYLDKFKPSNSAPVIEVHQEDVKMLLERSKAQKANTEIDAYEDMYSDISSLKKLLWFMTHHPFRHFSGELGYGKHLLYYVNSFWFNHPLLHFISYRFETNKEKLFKSIMHKIGMWKAIGMCKGLAKEKCVKKVEMVSFSNVLHEGWSTSHDYEISIVFNKESTVQECSEAFDRHVTSEKIGKFDYYGHVARIEHIVKESDYVDEDGNPHELLECINWRGRNDELELAPRYEEWYEDGIEVCKKKGKRELRSMLKKFPSVNEYALARNYDMETRTCLRAVGYVEGSEYVIVEDEIREPLWRRQMLKTEDAKESAQ